MSDEAALLNAIVAHADEDTPRLAYADWLDEHGRGDEAEFIRVQCRLADRSPADPDWFDLRERQFELVARLKTRLDAAVGPTADGFYFEPLMLDGLEEPFRRGFPHAVDVQHEGAEWTPAAVPAAAAEVERLLRTTTVRRFNVYEAPPAALAAVLAAPAAPLAGLDVRPFWSADPPAGAEVRSFYRFLATDPALRSVGELEVYGDTPAAGVAELATATALDAVRRLTVQRLAAPRRALHALTGAGWFRRLRHARFELPDAAVSGPVLTGLAGLPHLHTLELPDLAPAGVAPLAGGRFPALAALDYGGPCDTDALRRLAGAKFPRLSALKLPSAAPLKNGGLAELLRADWFGRLRALDLYECGVGALGVKALARHPVARGLRTLKLRRNPVGAGGLAAVLRGDRFPALTTLELGWHDRRKDDPAAVAAALAALDLPRLRHLDLSGWPLGSGGAKALAANPAVAGLTRLDLSECGIGDAGARALLASPHLRNLVELDLRHNAIRTGADALADPGTLPKLGECSLSGNRIPPKTAARFARPGLALSA